MACEKVGYAVIEAETTVTPSIPLPILPCPELPILLFWHAARRPTSIMIIVPSKASLYDLILYLPALLQSSDSLLSVVTNFTFLSLLFAFSLAHMKTEFLSHTTFVVLGFSCLRFPTSISTSPTTITPIISHQDSSTVVLDLDRH